MKKMSDFIDIKEDNLRDIFNQNLNNEAFREIVDRLKLNCVDIVIYLKWTVKRLLFLIEPVDISKKT